MVTDIRLAVSFRGHRKRRRLTRIIGPGATGFLIDLWLSIAENCPSGYLKGWDEEDIADACNWDGDPQKIVDALVECKLLDKVKDGYKLHDWKDHQSWVINAPKRADVAKKAAKARWDKRLNTKKTFENQTLNGDAESNAPSMQRACREQCTEHAESNAPSPTPSPSPFPFPSPTPDGRGNNSSMSEKISDAAPGDDGSRHTNQNVKVLEVDIKLAKYLKKHIEENSPREIIKDNVLNPDKWPNTFRLMREQDKRVPKEIAKVIRWATQDDFWRKNIRSPTKLRKQYARLYDEMVDKGGEMRDTDTPPNYAEQAWGRGAI